EGDQPRHCDDGREQGIREAAAHAQERSQVRQQARSRLAPVSTKPAVPDDARQEAPVEDIRSTRPYLLTRTTLVAVARRLLSIAALVTLDLAGLVFGIYVALILRALYRGEWPPLWGILWETETE